MTNGVKSIETPQIAAILRNNSKSTIDPLTGRRSTGPKKEMANKDIGHLPMGAHLSAKTPYG